MQDPSGFQAMKAQFPEQEHLKCPRCDSSNTKFCYYNNYNLSQPRHFCKNCRRYWTKGGTLRNIPVGGGSRKNAKRPTNPKRQNPDPEPDSRTAQTRRTHEPPSSPPQSVSSSTVVTSEPDPTRMYTLSADPERKMLDIIPGSFSSLLAANSQFGSLLNGLNPNGSGPKMIQLGDFTEDLNVASSGPGPGSGHDPALDEHGNNGSAESYLLQSGESNFWGGGAAASAASGGENGWPDLAIYTPGSGFQ